MFKCSALKSSLSVNENQTSSPRPARTRVRLLTASPVVSHFGGQLLQAAVALQLARVAVRDAVGAAHGLVVFRARRTLARRFVAPRPANGAEIARVPRARVRSVLCEKKTKSQTFSRRRRPSTIFQPRHTGAALATVDRSSVTSLA